MQKGRGRFTCAKSAKLPGKNPAHPFGKYENSAGGREVRSDSRLAGSPAIASENSNGAGFGDDDDDENEDEDEDEPETDCGTPANQ